MQKKSCTLDAQGLQFPHMNDTPKKRGRPRGSTSFTRVQLGDLVRQLGPDATIVISRRWLDEIGLTVNPAPVKREVLREVAEPEEKIQFSVNTFE
tara:strand:- start:116 stop:400 length:285 start_codon:yes stop_codon:yes gene_type:complete